MRTGGRMQREGTMWRSLRFRLLLGSILVVLIAVGVTAFVASRQTTGQFQRYVEERGDSRYRRFAGLLGRSYEMNLRWDDLQPEVERLGQAAGQRVLIADAQNKVVNDSERTLIGRSVGADWSRPSAIIFSRGAPVGTLYVDPVTGPSEADVAFLSAVNRSVLIGALIAGLGGRRGHAAAVGAHPAPGGTAHGGRSAHGEGRSGGARAGRVRG